MTAPADLEVTGGAGGVGAEFAALDHAVTLLQRSAAELRGAGADLHWGTSLLQGLDGVLADPGAALALEGGLLEVHGELQRIAESTDGLALLVAACVTGYRTAEEAARYRWSAVGALVGLTNPVAGLVGWVVTTNASGVMKALPSGEEEAAPEVGAPVAEPQPPVAGQGAVLGPPSGPQPLGAPGPSRMAEALAAVSGPQPTRLTGSLVPPPPDTVPSWVGSPGSPVPEGAQEADLLTRAGRLVGPGEEPFIGMLAGALVGGAGLLTPAAPLLMSRASSSGAARGIGTCTRTVVTPWPVAPAEVGPPTGIGDVLRRVEEAGDSSGEAGRIRVERITRADGSRSAVVYLPGTQHWGTGSALPASTDAIFRGVAGGPSAYTDAVVQAMEDAGVGPSEPVMLAGHSLGGITAAQMAADPAVRDRFQVRALVTAGSPVGFVDVPADVQSLSLEHGEDLVPSAEGVSNTAVKSNQVTVTAPTPGEVGAHDLSGYAALGDAVDASGDRSLTAYREATAQFFAAPGSTSAVTEVQARRVGP